MGHQLREARANGHLDVLNAIPAEDRAAVLAQCNERTVAKGALVWAQNDPAQYVAFLASGKAMSWYEAPSGKTGTTGFWCAGDLLGAADRHRQRPAADRALASRRASSTRFRSPGSIT
jgi:CRP-like cAMP-binding protein